MGTQGYPSRRSERRSTSRKPTQVSAAEPESRTRRRGLYRPRRSVAVAPLVPLHCAPETWDYRPACRRRSGPVWPWLLASRGCHKAVRPMMHTVYARLTFISSWNAFYQSVTSGSDCRYSFGRRTLATWTVRVVPQFGIPAVRTPVPTLGQWSANPPQIRPTAVRRGSIVLAVCTDVRTDVVENRRRSAGRETSGL